LRAITVVFVFSRASDFNVRRSSFVHGRSFVVFFAIFASLPLRHRIGGHRNGKQAG
jgi:hypothetical protein